MTTQTRYPEAARMFALDTARHTMTVRHDDGLYRHLSFRAPDTGLYWFDLVTWPGCLAFHGDMGTYVFARTADMIDFFAGPGDINPGYWAEKVRPSQHDVTLRAYDPDRARAHAADLFREYADTHGWPLAAVRDLWAALVTDVFEGEGFDYDERLARDALTNFGWHPTVEERGLAPLPGFGFSDVWEWDLTDFKHSFLYACFAVRHGVNRYRAHKINEGDPEAVTVFPSLARPPVPRPTPVPRPSTGQVLRVARGMTTSEPKEQYL
jgi:hypothetical protein